MAKGSDAGAPVHVAIAKGARELRLKVDSAGDGPFFDQSDWADARLTLDDGKELILDDGPIACPLAAGPAPFSFKYGGTKADLASWRKESTSKLARDFTEHNTTWSAPDGLLKVHATAKVYGKYSAIDWVLHFENIGAKDTPLIEGIQAVDAPINLGGIDTPATLHRLGGDDCGPRNFIPFDTSLATTPAVHFAPVGGRPSQVSAFPYFDIDNGKQGVAAAIGWTGQWAADVNQTPGKVNLSAGMELTHLVLHPGEKIRTPRILLMTWAGSREDGLNRWRRLLVHHYTPQSNGRPINLPFSLQCFDRYSWNVPTWSTEKGQIEAAQAAAKIGCDTHWLDASWFPGAFPNGVGNWSPKPAEFPHGLKPISDECHKLGINFMLWFEPERVGKNTEIAREHPDWVFGGANGGLFRLDLPEAQAWMTDLLSKRITEFGLDVYRQDFNMNPLDSWRANDAPDRQGMTEIRFVEGLYSMWDTLLAQHPGLRIDNCSSGGRRIDLEMGMRSMPLWRSDSGCGPGTEGYAQSQTVWLSQYVPIHSTCSWLPDAYEMRSAATAGLAMQFDYLAKDFNWAKAKAASTEVKENAKYWYGDFYALTAAGTADNEFLAYQFHRSDLDAGIILAFRREKAAFIGLILAPRGIKPGSKYVVDFIDEARKKTSVTMTGKQILEGGLDLRIPKQRASLLVRYRAVR